MQTSSVNTLMHSFANGIEQNNSGIFKEGVHNFIEAMQDEQELRSQLNEAMSKVCDLFEMQGDHQDLDKTLTVSTFEDQFFKAICQKDYNGMRYTISALKFETDSMFSTSVLDREFFVDVASYLKTHCVKDIPSLYMLNIPFIWNIGEQVPFKSIYLMARDFLEKSCVGPIKGVDAKEIFDKHSELISVYDETTDTESFWLFVVTLESISNSSIEMSVPSLHAVLEEEEIPLNTRDEDEYLADTYGVYMPRIDLDNIACILTEQIESVKEDEFLDELTDIVHAGAKADPNFVAEVYKVVIQDPGHAVIKLYSDTFDKVVDVGLGYSDWLPDNIAVSAILAMLDKFLEENPRYARFLELPGASTAV